ISVKSFQKIASSIKLYHKYQLGGSEAIKYGLPAERTQVTPSRGDCHMPAAFRDSIALAVALAITAIAQTTFAADSPTAPAAEEPRKPAEPDTEVLIVGTRA